jgi:hypothetical protein
LPWSNLIPSTRAGKFARTHAGNVGQPNQELLWVRPTMEHRYCKRNRRPPNKDLAQLPGSSARRHSQGGKRLQAHGREHLHRSGRACRLDPPAPHSTFSGRAPLGLERFLGLPILRTLVIRLRDNPGAEHYGSGVMVLPVAASNAAHVRMQAMPQWLAERAAATSHGQTRR